MVRFQQRSGISRVATLGIAVVVIIVIVVAAFEYPATLTPNPGGSTSTTSTTSTLTPNPGGSTSTTSTATSSAPSSITVEDISWPVYNLNQLSAVFGYPYSNWQEQSVYQPLIAVNESAEFQNGNVSFVPELAKSWTVSPDQMTYTFNLQPGVTFSNGDPLNAYQVWMEMYGWYFLAGNSSGWLISAPVFNMTNVHFGQGTMNYIMSHGGLITPDASAVAIMSNSSWSIYAPNANQIVFRLSVPYLYFLSAMIINEGLIFDSQYVLTNGGFGTATGWNTAFDGSPIPGTGPYVATQISLNSYAVFTQVPTYWAANQPALIKENPFLNPGPTKNIVVEAKTDDVSRYSDLSSGAAQLVSIQQQDLNLVISNPSKYSYSTLPTFSAGIYGLSFNVNRYPTNITDVRLAIAHAINNSEISQKAFSGFLRSWVGPEYPVFTSFYNLGGFSPYSYNLTLAAQLLSQAGFPGGKGMPALTFTATPSYPSSVTVGQIVQNDLSDIGITVNVDVETNANYSTPYTTYAGVVADASQEGQITVIGGGGWFPETLSPADAWESFVSNESTYGNWAGYSNPVVQACANAFLSSNNTAALQQVCKAAEAQIEADVPYDWTGSYILQQLGSGTVAWQNGVIKSFLLEPTFGSGTDIPDINTIVLG